MKNLSVCMIQPGVLRYCHIRNTSCVGSQVFARAVLVHTWKIAARSVAFPIQHLAAGLNQLPNAVHSFAL